MPGRLAIGGLTLAKRKKAPRPYRIEHRAVDPHLLKECPEWGEWQTYAPYATEKARDVAMGQLLNKASGRWEYRTAGGTDSESL